MQMDRNKKALKVAFYSSDSSGVSPRPTYLTHQILALDMVCLHDAFSPVDVLDSSWIVAYNREQITVGLLDLAINTFDIVLRLAVDGVCRMTFFDIAAISPQ